MSATLEGLRADPFLRISERVAGGAALLDEQMPGWADRIDLGAFLLANPCKCVIGQLFNGDYASGVSALGLRDDSGTLSSALAGERAHGFDDGDPVTLAALEREWVTVITERQAGDA